MSWGVIASGKPAEVKAALDEQFKFPLADKPTGLSHDGERETVLRIREAIRQILDTCGPETAVNVAAHGHIVFPDWESRAATYQEVSLNISPVTA